ncbi:MAG: hypothetical protein AAGH90_10655 [Pseudomonadota bacterium]
MDNGNTRAAAIARKAQTNSEDSDALDRIESLVQHLCDEIAGLSVRLDEMTEHVGIAKSILERRA